MSERGKDERGLYGAANMHSDPEFAAARGQRGRERCGGRWRGSDCGRQRGEGLAALALTALAAAGWFADGALVRSGRARYWPPPGFALLDQ
jgi:hypothetical protein